MPRLLAAKLRALRKQQGLTQVEVAQRLKLPSHSRITQLEGSTASGRNAPSLDLVVRLSALFQVATDYLLRDAIPIEPLPTADLGRSVEQRALQPHLGQVIRALRKERRLTQTSVATELGLADPGYWGNIEAGRKTPSLDLIVRIAEFFEVSTDVLLRPSPSSEL